MKNLGTYGLLTPQIYGFSKKQSTDPRIPDNTCVIFDEELYEKLHEYAFEESDNPEYDELIHGLRLIFMRHPVLWLTMYRDMRVWNRDTFAHHLATNHGILLDDYIDAKRNKDIVLLDTKSIVYFSHADGDGDLAPLFCLKRLPDTPDFNPMIPCQEELEWNQSYYDDEFSADNVMNKPLVYKLHFTPYTEKVVGRKRESGYITFLNNARKAKGAIGELVSM